MGTVKEHNLFVYSSQQTATVTTSDMTMKLTLLLLGLVAMATASQWDAFVAVAGADGFASLEEVIPVAKSMVADYDEAEVARDFAEQDEDGDGLISFDEFQDFLTIYHQK